MWLTAALHVLVAGAFAVGPLRQAPEPQPGPFATVACDPAGLIVCSLQETETVTGSRSLQDVRTIAHYIELIGERNRRYYMAWGTKLPSAAFELVKRVKSFPYIPYGDTYALSGMDISLDQKADRLSVRYPKYPKQNVSAPVSQANHAVYDTKLSVFIDALQKEIVKLKKYEK